MNHGTAIGLRTRLFVVVLFGALWLQADWLQRPLDVPTPTVASRARIMGYRYGVLENSLELYRETGHLLLLRDEKRGLHPVPSFDDVGTTLLVPPLVDLLGTSLDETIEWFFTFAVGLGVVAAIVGWCFNLTSAAARSVAIVFVLHFAAELSQLTDVYVVQGALALAVPPWILWWARRGKCDASLLTAVVAGAVVLSLAQLVRSHAATPLVLLAAVVFVANRSFTFRQKGVIAAAFVLAWFVPRVGLWTVQSQRDAYLVREHGWTEAELGFTDYRHPFWHSVYIGLGYRPNPYGIAYDDRCAIAKVAEIAGDDVAYMSAEYETVLRGECIRLATSDPGFVASALLTKARVAFGMLFEYASVGLLALVFAPFDWRRTLGFALAIAFASLFGILVVPERWYLLGMFGLGVGFAADTTGRLLDHHVPMELAGSWLRRYGEVGYRVFRMSAVAALLIVLTFEGRAVARAIGQRVIAARTEAKATAIADRLDSDERLLPTRASFRPMLWSVTDPAAELDWLEEGALLRTSPAGTAYQLEGPTLALSPGAQLAVRVELEVLAGAIVVGGLDEMGAWVFQRGCPEGEHVSLDVVQPANTASLKLLVTNANPDGTSVARIRRVDVLDARGIDRGDEPVTLSDAGRLDVAREAVCDMRAAGRLSQDAPLLDGFAKSWWANEATEIDWSVGNPELRTDESSTGYLLLGPVVEPPSGSVLVLHGEIAVAEGALVIGLLDDAGRWHFQQRFEPGTRERIDVVPLGETAAVRVVVANGLAAPGRSTARIARLELRHVNPSDVENGVETRTGGRR